MSLTLVDESFVPPELPPRDSVLVNEILRIADRLDAYADAIRTFGGRTTVHATLIKRQAEELRRACR